MFIALDVLGNRTHADDSHKEQEYFCPVCFKKLIVRHGEIMAWHFAHHPEHNCLDDWKYDTSEWHKAMQSFFPAEFQEIVVKNDGETHRADILKDNVVIEFQHSSISPEEVERRTDFYTGAGFKLVWIFDFTKQYYHNMIYEDYSGDLFTRAEKDKYYSWESFEEIEERLAKEREQEESNRKHYLDDLQQRHYKFETKICSLDALKINRNNPDVQVFFYIGNYNILEKYEKSAYLMRITAPWRISSFLADRYFYRFDENTKNLDLNDLFADYTELGNTPGYIHEYDLPSVKILGQEGYEYSQYRCPVTQNWAKEHGKEGCKNCDFCGGFQNYTVDKKICHHSLCFYNANSSAIEYRKKHIELRHPTWPVKYGTKTGIPVRCGKEFKKHHLVINKAFYQKKSQMAIR